MTKEQQLQQLEQIKAFIKKWSINKRTIAKMAGLSYHTFIQKYNGADLHRYHFTDADLVKLFNAMAGMHQELGHALKAK
jgi:hypothetical protein